VESYALSANECLKNYLSFMQKKLFLTKNLSSTLYYLGTKKFLALTKGCKSFYFAIPGNTYCVKEGDELIFTVNTKLDEIQFQEFSASISKWLIKIEKPLVKKLILKGLGLKASIVNLNTLELKLGFSHSVSIPIPSQLAVSIKKNVINVEGYDSVFLGNFLHKIRIIKKPNAYKGKGIWYKNELKVLKTVKKT